MTNKHCDFVDLDEAFDLMEGLGIEEKNKMAELYGVSYQQFNNWQRKGRVPAYQHSTLKHKLTKTFKAEYDRKMKLLGL